MKFKRRHLILALIQMEVWTSIISPRKSIFIAVLLIQNYSNFYVKIDTVVPNLRCKECENKVGTIGMEVVIPDKRERHQHKDNWLSRGNWAQKLELKPKVSTQLEVAGKSACSKRYVKINLFYWFIYKKVYWVVRVHTIGVLIFL